MPEVLRLLFVLCAFETLSNAQFFFNQPFNFFNPPQFQMPFQLFPVTTPPTTTTTEFIPDPDREIGNFPLPNPANWPRGPDWNDPRNNNQQQLGWGGNGLIGTTSSRPSIVVSTAATTTATVQSSTTHFISSTIRPIAMTRKILLALATRKPTEKRSSLKRASTKFFERLAAAVQTKSEKTRLSSTSNWNTLRKKKSFPSLRSH